MSAREGDDFVWGSWEEALGRRPAEAGTDSSSECWIGGVEAATRTAMAGGVEGETGVDADVRVGVSRVGEKEADLAAVLLRGRGLAVECTPGQEEVGCGRSGLLVEGVKWEDGKA